MDPTHSAKADQTLPRSISTGAARVEQWLMTITTPALGAGVVRGGKGRRASG